MAYIQPNATIKILSGVPLDNDYQHTIYFQRSDIQATYFESKVVYSFTEQSYQRVGKNKLRIQMVADRLYHCNYMYFKNDLGFEFTPKIFYCFITDVEYINNNVSEITYQIDVIQTFHFDYTLNRCYVEREHTESDNLFDNIVAENLELGSEYVVNGKEFFDMNQMKLCILVNRKAAGDSTLIPIPRSNIINNIYTPVRVFEDFDVNLANVENIDTALNVFQENDIICVYQYPSVLYKPTFPDLTVKDAIPLSPPTTTVTFNVFGRVPATNELSGYQIYFGGTSTVYTIVSNTGTTLTLETAVAGVPAGTVICPANQVIPFAPVPHQIVTMNSTIDGHSVRNRKLFSYPFNKLCVSNNCGETAEYKWEFLSLDGNNQTLFNIEGAVVTTPSALCYPVRYRNVEPDYETGIVYNNFPQCAWSGDTFKTWWAQNKAVFATGVMTSALNTAIMMGAGIGSALNPFPGATGSVNDYLARVDYARGQTVPNIINQGAANIGGGIASSVAQINKIKNTPSQTHGHVLTDSLNCALGRVGFTFYHLSVNRQIAEIIDDYFDKFGYAVKRVKTINRNAREEWTYVKTIGCTIESTNPSFSINQSFEKEITAIYDNGITFWADPAHVAQYDRRNRPRSEVNS